MIDQPELDLPSPPDRRRRSASAPVAGGSVARLLFGLLLVGALAWGMWVTHALLAPPPARIVSARLSALVGEYVQAAARSPAPAAQVEADMRSFMALLDRELQRRAREGQIVLVGEAVLTRNVPDITAALRRAVYAGVVGRPRPAAARPAQAERPTSAAAPAASEPVPSPFAVPPDPASGQ